VNDDVAGIICQALGGISIQKRGSTMRMTRQAKCARPCKQGVIIGLIQIGNFLEDQLGDRGGPGVQARGRGRGGRGKNKEEEDEEEKEEDEGSGGGGGGQGLTLVHVRAQLEQLQDTFMS